MVYQNLKNAFPEKTPSEIDSIARKFYRHLSDFIVETIKLFHISKRQLDKRFRILNPEIFRELNKEGRQITLISGHYGNWEWMCNMPEKIPQHILVIYYPLKNKVIDKLILRLRTQFGGDLVSVKDFYKRIVNMYSKGQPTGAWFLGDQRPLRKNPFWTKFLNQDTAFYLGPEKVARRFKHAVVFMDINKVGRGYFEVHFDLLTRDASALPDLSVTEMHVQKLESIIRERPEYWLWSHRRWKHKPPKPLD